MASLARPILVRNRQTGSRLQALDLLLPLIYPPDTLRFNDRAKRQVAYLQRRPKHSMYAMWPNRIADHTTHGE